MTRPIPDGLMEILCCPDCRNPLQQTGPDALSCESCRTSNETTSDGILVLMPRAPKPLPPAYEDPDYKKMSNHFDDASDYFTDSNSFFRRIHESSHRYVKNWGAGAWSNGWVCDVGCGQGFHWPFFSGDRSRLIGIDMRLTSLRRIKSRWPKAFVIQADSTRLPFRASAVENAISIYALEHIYHLRDAVEEMGRVVTAGGHLYVGLPCEGGAAYALGRKLTSERTMSKRFDVDYRKYISLEHCNDANDVVSELRRLFRINRIRYFPLNLLPSIATNLTITLELVKNQPGEGSRTTMT